MKLLILSVTFICAFLQGNSQNPKNHWTLLPNILVVVVDGSMGQQLLTCLWSEDELMRRHNRSEDISWRKNGAEEAQTGNWYQVQLEESLGGGNYSCHSQDGALLNHTVVLIQEDQTKKRKILVNTGQADDYLKCSALNYDGQFQCSWTWDSSRVSSVALIKVRRDSDNLHTLCSVDTRGRRWTCSSGDSSFACSLDGSGRRVSCVDERHCPYAEESRQIHVTVYVRTEHFLLEKYSQRFLLSDIVKPDKVKISKVNTTVIEWSYPTSWSSPYSYFPLTFEIAQLRRRCRRCENPCSDSKNPTKPLTVHSTEVCHFEVKRQVKAVCVRAKDALCNSEWSEWSHLRLKGGGSSRQKNRKKE